ncbi:cell division protein SepF [Bifidobacterium sp. CP2]|uniref:cell division protein SepF n=1 Tax=Bifidobacterium TaxID=1678 RepID=UPI001BDC727A|nr:MULTISPECIES: cell division protein SepF [Bifidobacterium]MBT1180984.1 cell division protein SepF [Bifidobacterium sp. CP2]MBW3080854.1 cell division protein SepF [Bifidobacterium saguinibicoloris]
MAGFMKNAMSYLGMSDVAEEDDDFDVEEEPETPAETPTSFDSDRTVTPMPTKPSVSSSPASSSTASSRGGNPFQGRLSRITTIHPKSYDDAQMVGRAIRDGVPVVLNLTGVSEAVAYRIIDFSAGVVFGVHGSMERVTPRVFLLSPAQVNIKVEESASANSARDLFAD